MREIPTTTPTNHQREMGNLIRWCVVVVVVVVFGGSVGGWGGGGGGGWWKPERCVCVGGCVCVCVWGGGGLKYRHRIMLFYVCVLSR